MLSFLISDHQIRGRPWPACHSLLGSLSIAQAGGWRSCRTTRPMYCSYCLFLHFAAPGMLHAPCTSTRANEHFLLMHCTRSLHRQLVWQLDFQFFWQALEMCKLSGRVPPNMQRSQHTAVVTRAADEMFLNDLDAQAAGLAHLHARRGIGAQERRYPTQAKSTPKNDRRTALSSRRHAKCCKKGARRRQHSTCPHVHAVPLQLAAADTWP